MDTSLEDVRRTIQSVVHLASFDNNKSSLQINAQQCEFLAKKASDITPILDEFEYTLRKHDLNLQRQSPLRTNPEYWTPAAIELHQVLKDAEVLIQDCNCDDRWLQFEIKRGNLKETFAKIVYDLEWHASVLCWLLEPESSVTFEEWQCNGTLRLNESFILSSAAKRDRESLRDRLTNSHVCDGEVCKPDTGEKCLAKQILVKLDAELIQESVDRSNFSDLLPRFLWINPKHLPKGRTLGQGSFGKVRETEWLGQKFAVKKCLDGSANNNIFKQELAAMAGLDHPNIVRVVCCAEDNRKISIVIELMYKSLYDLLHQDLISPTGKFSQLPILQSVDLMLQIGEGLRYLHGMKVAHRDLKSLNILVQFADPRTAIPDSKGMVNITKDTALVAKIADFGLAKVKNVSTMLVHQTANLGTTQWMAPEVPKRGLDAASDRFHPMKADIYSFAIICSEILSGEEPFRGLLGSKLKKAVRDGERPDLPEGIPKRLEVLIKRCWDGEPLARPDCPEICTELRFLKALLLRGDNIANDIGFEINIKLQSVKVQGPWGGNREDHPFSSGIITSMKRIKLHYDRIATNFWYLEMEYNVNGRSIVIAYGERNHGTASTEVHIDESCEYITQIEGSFGTSINLPNHGEVLTTLSIHTNKKTHGPFGRDKMTGSETKFKSGSGRIVGFFGNYGTAINKIGCFIIL